MGHKIGCAARQHRLSNCRPLALMAYSCVVVGGEFNIGSALQYGEADIKGKDFSGQVNILPACISFFSRLMEGSKHNPSTNSAPYLPFTVTLGILFADILDKGYSLS